MTIPMHNANELRHIADVLDVLNRASESDSVGFDGKIEMFWCDRLLGVLEVDEPDDLNTWVYRPANDSLTEGQ